ncbi:glypican-5-like isoform X4 [Chamaea fasciata]|uniref:glypican-5-like isoform X4 n=1 Tax=Chamaea fasciata TaxID=190680 RepID=UPI00336AE86D
MAAGGSRAVLGLWLLAAGLCGAVAAGGSPSCHEVRTAFQLRQIGPLKLVPDVPTAESDLQICQHRAPTCCTKKMEESYQAAVRRERTQSIQALNFELKYMIVGHITAFQEAFESLLRFAENRTSSLFETAYRPMAKEAAEPVKELFTDISLYILGAETTVESAVLRFFDSLFPLVYSRLINPGITDLSEDYTECLRLTRQDINPFGHYSKNLVTELSKSLWASRMLSQALSLGIEVINTTEHAALSKECSRALVKMQYCPHCQGLTLIRPCVGYCLNVMRGCLASVSELDAQWREFISTLEYLTNEMAASHELEVALSGIWSSINEAILHAQLNGPQLSATVDKVCGQPKQQEGNLSSANIVPVKEVTETQTFVMAHTSLNNKRSLLGDALDPSARQLPMDVCSRGAESLLGRVNAWVSFLRSWRSSGSSCRAAGAGQVGLLNGVPWPDMVLQGEVFGVWLEPPHPSLFCTARSAGSPNAQSSWILFCSS